MESQIYGKELNAATQTKGTGKGIGAVKGVGKYEKPWRGKCWFYHSEGYCYKGENAVSYMVSATQGKKQTDYPPKQEGLMTEKPCCTAMTGHGLVKNAVVTIQALITNAVRTGKGIM